MPPHTRTRAFAGDIRAERETEVLLAIQKVEGSNPFSRFDAIYRESRRMHAAVEETAPRHGVYEAMAAPDDWWDWYAAYFHARQNGSTPHEAF
jgi:hypothetical protein